MSTKRTLWLKGETHLYLEAWDDDNVYLELPASGPVEILTIKIPIADWEEMRKRAPFVDVRGRDSADHGV